MESNCGHPQQPVKQELMFGSGESGFLDLLATVATDRIASYHWPKEEEGWNDPTWRQPANGAAEGKKAELHFKTEPLSLIKTEGPEEVTATGLAFSVLDDHCYAVSSWKRPLERGKREEDGREEETMQIETSSLFGIVDQGRRMEFEDSEEPPDLDEFLKEGRLTNLCENIRGSANEIFKPKPVRRCVPLIGSEVEVGIGRRKRRSLDDSSDSGTEVGDDSEREKLEAMASIVDLQRRGARTDDLACKICRPSRTFTAYTTLLSHLRSHARILPYDCHVCGAAFSRRNSLNHHLQVHQNETRFTCADCGRKFRHEGRFNEHERVCTSKKAQLPSQMNEGLVDQIFKDVSNIKNEGPEQPTRTVFWASINGKRVLLVPRQDCVNEKQMTTSKLEQCLRFGSAAVSKEYRDHSAPNPTSTVTTENVITHQQEENVTVHDSGLSGAL